MEGARVGRPQTRYVETPLGYLAYQTFGSGDRDIIFVTSALSNVDVIWDEPSAARFLDRLSTMGRVILYDMRGSGVSDPIPRSDRFLPIEENVDDMRAVLDEVGSTEAVVYGDAEGGLWAMMLAAVDPGRVSALVLVNAFPRLIRSDDYPIGMPREVSRKLSEMYVAQHGVTADMLELTAPSVANDPRFRTWFTRYQRLSIPPGLIKSTFDWYGEVDVRAALPLVSVPTLVVARRDGRFHRMEYGKYIADHIDGAEFRIVDGADTVPFHAGDFDPTLDAVEEFVTGNKDVGSVDRVLSTVLFTDIVGSTARAADLGDQRWMDLLTDHNVIIRAQLARFRGQEITMTGDGCVATFDGPARAVACAVAIAQQLSPLDIAVRAGIHTGEVEFRHGEIGGLGVHIASRVMGQAETGGILVSSTVKDLIVGSGIDLDACGTFDLKGVPGQWDLYEVRTGRTRPT